MRDISYLIMMKLKLFFLDIMNFCKSKLNYYMVLFILTGSYDGKINTTLAIDLNKTSK